MDRKSLTGPFNFTATSNKVQFSSTGAAVSSSLEMKKPKVSDSMSSMPAPNQDDTSKLLQSDRAK